MARATPETIRALGFDWPHAPLIERAAFYRSSGEVELSVTLDNLLSEHQTCERQVRDAQSFKASTGADYSDFTDRFDELASKLHDLKAACTYVERIIAALPPDAPTAPSGRSPNGRSPSGRPPLGDRAGVVGRNLREAPWPMLAGVSVVFGAIGAFVLQMASEGDEWLIYPGAFFLGVALATLITLAGIVALNGIQRLRRTPAWMRRFVAAPGRRRMVLVAVAGFGVSIAFVLYNWLCWYDIHRTCNAASDAESRDEAIALVDQATESMNNPLLVLPSDLFDLWGPSRCRSARERFEPSGAPE